MKIKQETIKIEGVVVNILTMSDEHWNDWGSVTMVQ